MNSRCQAETFQVSFKTTRLQPFEKVIIKFLCVPESADQIS